MLRLLSLGVLLILALRWLLRDDRRDVVAEAQSQEQIGDHAMLASLPASLLRLGLLARCVLSLPRVARPSGDLSARGKLRATKSFALGMVRVSLGRRRVALVRRGIVAICKGGPAPLVLLPVLVQLSQTFA